MIWQVTRVALLCPRCDQLIQTGASIARLTAKQLIRCEACARALGGVPDKAAIDADLLAFEREALTNHHGAEELAAASHTAVDRLQRRRAAAAQTPLTQSKLGWVDPKRAAANDR